MSVRMCLNCHNIEDPKTVMEYTPCGACSGFLCTECANDDHGLCVECIGTLPKCIGCNRHYSYMAFTKCTTYCDECVRQNVHKGARVFRF